MRTWKRRYQRKLNCFWSLNDNFFCFFVDCCRLLEDIDPNRAKELYKESAAMYEVDDKEQFANETYKTALNFLVKMKLYFFITNILSLSCCWNSFHFWFNDYIMFILRAVGMILLNWWKSCPKHTKSWIIPSIIFVCISVWSFCISIAMILWLLIVSIKKLCRMLSFFHDLLITLHEFFSSFFLFFFSNIMSLSLINQFWLVCAVLKDSPRQMKELLQMNFFMLLRVYFIVRVIEKYHTHQTHLFCRRQLQWRIEESAVKAIHFFLGQWGSLKF